MSLSSLLQDISSGPIVFYIIIIIFVVFTIFRELTCWYWKINERISLLEKTLVIQRKILDIQTQIGNQLVNLTTESQKTREEIAKNNTLPILQELLSKLTKDKDISSSTLKTDSPTFIIKNWNE